MKVQVKVKSKAPRRADRPAPRRPIAPRLATDAWSQWLALLDSQPAALAALLAQLPTDALEDWGTGGPWPDGHSLPEAGLSCGGQCPPYDVAALEFSPSPRLPIPPPPHLPTAAAIPAPQAQLALTLNLSPADRRTAPHSFVQTTPSPVLAPPILQGAETAAAAPLPTARPPHRLDLSVAPAILISEAESSVHQALPSPELAPEMPPADSDRPLPHRPAPPTPGDAIGDHWTAPPQENLPVEACQEPLDQEAPEPEKTPEESPESPAESWFHSKAQAGNRPPPPTPLPYRAWLESRLGQSLADLQVFAGTPEVQEILAELGAIAAHHRGQLLFAEAQPSLETVLHEVIHALQTQSGNAAAPPTPVQPSAAAEREATALAAALKDSAPDQGEGAWAEVAIGASLPAEAIACLRDAPTSPAATPADAFAATADPDRPPLSPSVPTPTAPAEAPAPSPAQAETEAALDTEAAPAVTADLEEVPALEAPAPPESGITAEDMAAREAELAAAEAALASATDVDEKVAAYAAAPPSLKAQSYGSLGSDLDSLAKAENQSFQGEVPDFQAKLSGDTEALPELRVEAPPGGAVALETVPPAPAPDPDIPPTPDPTPYTGNRGILSAIARFSEGNAPQDRASEIGGTLRDVSTTDPEVETDPGPPPAVPLEGETDPQRIADQIEAGTEQAAQARDQAQQAVLDGPGPERVQPLVMDEAVPLGELVQPELSQPEPVPGVDEFSQREMPPEVTTAFDQTNQETMQASLAEAQTQVQQTTDERDRQRQEQLDTAQAEADRQTEQADQSQRDQVQNQRRRIQDERQHTLEAQTQAVREVEAETETRRQSDQAAIDGRVRDDQATIRDDYAEAEQEADAEVGKGEQQAEEERRQAEREAENQSWWDRAVNFVQRAFEALTSAIGAIFDAVRSAINTILDAVKAAAEALINAAANFIKSAIALFGDFLKGLVDGLLGELFPELAAALNALIDEAVQLAQQAVDAVAETLRNGINMLVEGLRAGLNAVLDVLQAGLEFATALIQAALAGDWGAVIRLLLEAVLKVVGIEPETFYGFIGRAEETFQKLVDDPGAVVGHLLDALSLGIQNFADNFLTHLQTGIIGWLTGALGADLQIPTEFNLLGVLDLARQVMGLTLQFIRRIAVRLIGEENVERIESMLEYVQTLITGGWSALFEQISESLGNVRDLVFEQIKEFLVTRLVVAAITKLVTMFNPIGAIVQLVMTLWNVYTFLRDNLQRLIQVVQTIVDSLSQIVQGVIATAASGIETALANLLPVAISFLANLLGIGGIGNRVRRIIDGLRDRIENAIVRFIQRIASRFTGRGRSSATESAAETTPEDIRSDEQKLAAVRQAVADAEQLQNRPNITLEEVRSALPNLQRQHQLSSIELVHEQENIYHVLAVINPRLETRRKTYRAHFTLAPGGFEAHENMVIVAATATTTAQTVHMISRHGPDVPDQVLIGRIEVLRDTFRQELQRRTDRAQDDVNNRMAALGTAIQRGRNPERQDTGLIEAEIRLQALRQMNTANTDVMYEQLREWGIRNIPERATRFHSTNLMFSAVQEALSENAERIDNDFRNPDGSIKDVGTRSTIRHSLRGSVGIGFELTSSHQARPIGASELTRIVVVARLINSTTKHYVVETAYPT